MILGRAGSIQLNDDDVTLGTGRQLHYYSVGAMTELWRVDHEAVTI